MAHSVLSYWVGLGNNLASFIFNTLPRLSLTEDSRTTDSGGTNLFWAIGVKREASYAGWVCSNVVLWRLEQVQWSIGPWNLTLTCLDPIFSITVYLVCSCISEVTIPKFSLDIMTCGHQYINILYFHSFAFADVYEHPPLAALAGYDTDGTDAAWSAPAADVRWLEVSANRNYK